MEMQAKALYDSGHYEEGIELETRVLQMRAAVLGPTHPDVAVAFDNLAALYQDTGDYARAEQLLDLAWQIVAKLPPEHPYSTRIRNNQASMYDDRGDYETAKRLYQIVVALRQKLADEKPLDAALAEVCKRQSNGPDECQNQLDLAISLNDLAAVHEHEGEYDQAETLFKTARAIAELLLSTDDQFVLRLVNNIAVVYDLKGDKAQAEKLFQHVLSVRRQSLGEKHPEVALTLNNLAAFYLRTGNLQRAEESLQRALEITGETLPPDHVDTGLILSNLSALAMAKGDYIQSLSWLKQASIIQERHLALVLAIGSERQKQSYLDTLISDTNQAVTLNALFSPHDEEATNLALTTILQRKGRTLDAMSDTLSLVRRSGTLRDRSLFHQLQTVGTRLANRHVLGPPQTGSPTKWQTELTRDAAVFEQLEREMSRRSIAFRTQAQPVTVDMVRKQIPCDGVLIEFFEYLPFDPAGPTEAARWKEPHYIAYVVRSDMAIPQVVNLGPAAQIDEKIKLLRGALRNPERWDVDDLARSVGDSVMKPIRPLLGNRRHLLLSPDGMLNLVPFAVLLDERGRYLVEDYSLTYLTSGRDLLRLKEQSVHPTRPGKPIVIADPMYDMKFPDASVRRRGRYLPIAIDGNRRSVELAAMKFSSLSGARDEGTAVAKLLSNARLLTQAQATETAVKQVRGPRVLHIATHGFFDADTLSSTELKQTQVETNENPLLRAGLVFSGANHLQGGNHEDGILTGLEVAGLDLSGTKLVVLSGCETGVGDIQTGNGVYGLRRAFVLAGAESQLMTLWGVDDETTRHFMVRYYNLLKAGQGRSEALRTVQLEMLSRKGNRSRQSHPYYWAAFIQSGQWKNLAGQEIP